MKLSINTENNSFNNDVVLNYSNKIISIINLTWNTKLAELFINNLKKTLDWEITIENLKKLRDEENILMDNLAKEIIKWKNNENELEELWNKIFKKLNK